MQDNMGRRRSVDVGGLARALTEEGCGQGWVGFEEEDCGEPRYAEHLTDVRMHTEVIMSQDFEPEPPLMDMRPEVRERLIESLSSWHFEPRKLPPEEMVTCSYILFEALYCIENMEDTAGAPLSQLATFLQHLRQLYRPRNSYHNYDHALDVLQAIYFFLCSAGLVPPVTILREHNRTWTRDLSRCDPHAACLTDSDIFTLYIVAVGHDVGHPGLNNDFMRNAKTPLSFVYDDKSVLEWMHYNIITKSLRWHNLGILLDRQDAGHSFRQLLLGTVLVTDMGVHLDFMKKFEQLIESGDHIPDLEKRLLLCQALIKCADISNPCRPYAVSKAWAAALESEWCTQRVFEKHLHLPQSVKPSETPQGEAKGQIWFSTTFVRPLFDLVGRHLPSMEQFAGLTRDNLVLWQQVIDEFESAAEVSPKSPDTPMAWPSQTPDDFRTVFQPALPESFRMEEPCTPFDHHSFRDPSLRPNTSPSSSEHSNYESCESSLPSPTFSPVLNPESPALGSHPPHLELVSPSPPPTQSRAPSVLSMVASMSESASSSLSSDATASIRAAYKAGVRKKKSFHRTSWNPPPTSMSSTPPSDSSGSPTSPGGTGPGSPSTGSMTPSSVAPSPLTPAESSAPVGSSAARPMLLKAALVSASS
ncbi:HD-domain/PDEase-like protein [Epithele typhae]|uniref:HD-domain/PDEase-like protein n=1 Tax=Epithele typhae TaxID=378194 RepID=UPI002007EBF1|nr:HD-domain/PDEase-like protein [Epithele typhae]KAH9917671.1 HD-domain/PDEase-like protein [Epithele typhae]